VTAGAIVCSVQKDRRNLHAGAFRELPLHRVESRIACRVAKAMTVEVA